MKMRVGVLPWAAASWIGVACVRDRCEVQSFGLEPGIADGACIIWIIAGQFGVS